MKSYENIENRLKVVENQMATGPQGVEANEAETCGLPLEGYECLSRNHLAAVRFSVRHFDKIFKFPLEQSLESRVALVPESVLLRILFYILLFSIFQVEIAFKGSKESWDPQRATHRSNTISSSHSLGPRQRPDQRSKGLWRDAQPPSAVLHEFWIHL